MHNQHNQPRLEDRILTYLILIQVLGVFFGWALLALGVGLWNRVGHYGAKSSAVFMRDWGMFFFLIPVGWLALAILIQRHGHLRFDGPLIFWSGIAVAMGTVIILACIGLSSGASLIQVVE
ncbi:MAG: hypothetical protein VCA38_18490 [Roseibacillus sp.]|jgi:hypothetical protein